jgi:hypothetical protein
LLFILYFCAIIQNPPSILYPPVSFLDTTLLA